MGALVGIVVATVGMLVAGSVEAWLVDAFDLSHPHWLGRSVFWAVLVLGIVGGVRVSFWIDERRRASGERHVP